MVALIVLAFLVWLFWPRPGDEGCAYYHYGDSDGPS